MTSGLSRADRMRLAVVAFDEHRTPNAVAVALRDPSGLLNHLDGMSVERRAALDARVTELLDRDFDVVLSTDIEYPDRLNALRRPPAVLFTWGSTALLSAPGVGMCGSRNVSAKGLEAARVCGLEVAEHGLVVISGYAKGVDTETHLAALRSGGRTIIVLAEGISYFREKRAFADVGLDPDRVLVLSQFAPGLRWNVGAAMTRNGVITSLGSTLVVIEAGETGGTLNAGQQALGLGRPVLALEFSEGTPAGNTALLEKGARPIHSRQGLGRALDEISTTEPHRAVRPQRLF